VLEALKIYLKSQCEVIK